MRKENKTPLRKYEYKKFMTAIILSLARQNFHYNTLTIVLFSWTKITIDEFNTMYLLLLKIDKMCA